MHVVIGRAGGDHAAVLVAVDVPEAPCGLMNLLVLGRDEIAIRDSSKEEDFFLPVFDVSELLVGFAELPYVVAAESSDLGEFAGEQHDGDEGRGGGGILVLRDVGEVRFVVRELDFVGHGDDPGWGAAAVRGGDGEAVGDARRGFDGNEDPGPFVFDHGLCVHQRGAGSVVCGGGGFFSGFGVALDFFEQGDGEEDAHVSEHDEDEQSAPENAIVQRPERGDGRRIGDFDGAGPEIAVSAGTGIDIVGIRGRLSGLRGGGRALRGRSVARRAGGWAGSSVLRRRGGRRDCARHGWILGAERSRIARLSSYSGRRLDKGHHQGGGCQLFQDHGVNLAQRASRFDERT